MCSFAGHQAHSWVFLQAEGKQTWACQDKQTRIRCNTVWHHSSFTTAVCSCSLGLAVVLDGRGMGAGHRNLCVRLGIRNGPQTLLCRSSRASAGQRFRSTVWQGMHTITAQHASSI